MPGTNLVPKIKTVKNPIIRKKRKYYQNKLKLESNSKTKNFFQTFNEMRGKEKKFQVT